MRVHMTLFFWWFLILNIVWREYTKGSGIQAKLHKLGPLAFLLQWHVLFFIGYGLVLAWSVYEMVTHYLPLSDAAIESHLTTVWEEEFGSMKPNDAGFVPLDQFRKELLIRGWLRVLSWAAVFASIGVYVTIFGHIAKVAYDGNRSKTHDIDGSRFSCGVWKVPIRMNMVILILVNPGVFSVMALRALCRIWALMTGQASNHHGLGWPEVKTLEHAMFTGDMELAQAFQYFAVHVFARLCAEYLSDSGILRAYRRLAPGTHEHEFHEHAKQYRRMVRWAAFLAVHAFVAIGMIRCFIDFIICEVRIYDSYQLAAENVQNQMSSKLTLVFQAFTILCVINMKIICDMKDITNKLAKASMIFMGTRILLLVSDNQAMIVQAFTLETRSYDKLMDATANLSFQDDLSNWNFHEHQARLFHLSLLNIECLICVLFNVAAWRSLDVEKSELMSTKPSQELLDLEKENEGKIGLLENQEFEQHDFEQEFEHKVSR